MVMQLPPNQCFRPECSFVLARVPYYLVLIILGIKEKSSKHLGDGCFQRREIDLCRDGRRRSSGAPLLEHLQAPIESRRWREKGEGDGHFFLRLDAVRPLPASQGITLIEISSCNARARRITIRIIWGKWEIF